MSATTARQNFAVALELLPLIIILDGLARGNLASNNLICFIINCCSTFAFIQMQVNIGT